MPSSAALLLSICCILVSPTIAAVHERLHAVPSGWTATSTPSDDNLITLQVALVQQNVAEFEARLMNVSTPGHELYGQFMEGDAVSALLKPSDASNEAVLAWLNENGVSGDNVTSDGEFVTFATTVGNANEFLNTTFQNFESGGATKLRTTQYSVPATVSSHIDFITPTISFMKGRTKTARPVLPRKREAILRRLDATCADLITPQCLKELYNINNYTADPKSGSTIGFGSFLNETARMIDLSLFETEFGIPQQSLRTELINGGVNNQNITGQHGEANLDVEYIIGISHPLPVTSFITGGSPPILPNLDVTEADNSNEPYLPYYQYLLSKSNSELPNVITNSYGDDEQSVPLAYAMRVCNMIGQMGLRGITVIESAGDTGELVPFPSSQCLGVGAPCQSNDGLATPQFTPQFPGTCSFITAVGGTQSISPEVAWTAGSGGFSNYFTRPLYQELFVENYLKNHIEPETLEYYKPFTNVKMRGFPDVAAHSLAPNFAVTVDNASAESGGTSASAPTFAGTIALLNDARFRAGKGPLGFLNPWLYAAGFLGLTDITRGGSVGCNGIDGQTGASVEGGVIPFASWNATPGWDPVTGLGVPNFEGLKALALAL